MHGQLPARAEGPLYAGTLQWGVAETQHFVNPYFSMQVTQFRRNSTPCMVNTRGPKARTVCRGFSQWGALKWTENIEIKGMRSVTIELVLMVDVSF